MERGLCEDPPRLTSGQTGQNDKESALRTFSRHSLPVSKRNAHFFDFQGMLERCEFDQKQFQCEPSHEKISVTG
jgi:hypothetical protein